MKQSKFNRQTKVDKRTGKRGKGQMQISGRGLKKLVHQGLHGSPKKEIRITITVKK